MSEPQNEPYYRQRHTKPEQSHRSFPFSDLPSIIPHSAHAYADRDTIDAAMTDGYGEIRLVIKDEATLSRVIQAYVGGPAHMNLGGVMAAGLTIDSVNARAVLAFQDRLGEPDDAPAGLVSTATSDHPEFLAVGAQTAGTDPATGKTAVVFPLTEAGAGTATLSVATTNADGSPLTGPDGNPIPDPPPVTLTVSPGAPAAERFVVVGS